MRSSLCGLPLIRRVGFDNEGVNLAADPIAEGRVDHLVPRQAALAGKCGANYHSLIMALAIGRNRCPGTFQASLNQALNLTGFHRRQVSCSSGKPVSLSQMVVNTRNLLLFAALSCAAVLTGVFSSIAVEPAPTSTDPGPAPQGYYVIGAVQHVTNDEGRVLYRIVAERVEQQAEGEDFVFDEISVEYMPDTDVHWDISADRGVTPASRDVLRLRDNVRLVYAPDASHEELVFETNELSLVADEFYVTSDQPITVRKDGTDLTAMGLNLNLETDDWNLGPNVTTRITH